MINSEVLHLSDLSFGELVLGSEGYILVDFYVASSLDCQKQGAIIEDLAPKYKKKIIIAKLDVDKNPGITSRFRVTETPTLVLFKDGEEIDRLTGFVSEEELIPYLDKVDQKKPKEQKEEDSEEDNKTEEE